MISQKVDKWNEVIVRFLYYLGVNVLSNSRLEQVKCADDNL